MPEKKRLLVFSFLFKLFKSCLNINIAWGSAYFTKLKTIHYQQKYVARIILTEDILTHSRSDCSHYEKSVRIWSFSGPYFPAFGLNSERYSVYLRIQSECGNVRARKTPNKDTFHAVSML